MRAESGRPRHGLPAEPWRSFLNALDERLTSSHELHCIGGFVVTQHYGISSRETSDIDFLSVVSEYSTEDIESIAGLKSELHRRYRLYMQRVTVTTAPADYEKRLAAMFSDAQWKHLRLFALDPHDLALSKLERNAERDREDVLALARAGYLDAKALRERYENEQRPYLLGEPSRHDLTIELWIEMCWPSA